MSYSINGKFPIAIRAMKVEAPRTGYQEMQKRALEFEYYRSMALKLGRRMQLLRTVREKRSEWKSWIPGTKQYWERKLLQEQFNRALDDVLSVEFEIAAE